MSCEETSPRLADLLRGELPHDEERALRQHLRECPTCAREAAELEALWDEMRALEPEESPSPALRARFYSMLAEEQRKERGHVPVRERLAHAAQALAALWPRRPAWQMGIAAALLMIGILAGRASAPRPGGGSGEPVEPTEPTEIAALRGEVRSLSHLVAISMLQQDSAASRLQGVAYGRRAAGSDERVLAALLEAATRDPNVNVRLAAIDALAPELGRAAVRAELLASFAAQPSPLVQVAVVDAVAGADGSASRQALRPLLDLPRLDPAVRKHLDKVVATTS